MSDPATPSDRAALLVLAERVERGERTYALEQDIQSLVRPELAPYMSPPAYLSSLDAAVSLMPEGYAWMVGCDMGVGYFAVLQTTEESGLPHHAVDVHGAASPARAMTAAALRARAEGA